ncbi:hypothetical protein FB45DRAFT_975262 [Roridomyces roridus]|uniref:PH domain-containing protein n=1 Tax=Roridomyces roridus TaxID=1738132 RepID=A0AAD7CFU8_9AGAR|nr:hypothetical protein FB45DRAFT_975262 [Roridomyces roridus]
MTSPRHAASPLRDRLLSNSPVGWSDQPRPASPNVSPLRIAKQRDPQVQVARRTSSSFKHVRNNNLVTKSPFKSQIPMSAASPAPMPRPFPSPRHVSGEKRQRPQSLHDQAEAENDRPFAYKRERRQSKGFQGLIQREPVTKSPFRHLEDPVPEPTTSAPIPVPPTPSRIPVLAGPTAASPARSSLVSRRMHGPRLSGRRERRKTVTFDERCDVVEFDRDEEDGTLSGEEDEDEDDPFFAPPQSPPEESSYESIELEDADANGSLLPDTPMPLGLDDLDPDVSISGLVNAMFAPTTGTSTPPLGSSYTRNFTPELDRSTDLDTEDGVPFGRSHHATRAAAFHAQPHVHAHATPPPHLDIGGSGGGGRPLPRPEHSGSARAATTPPHASTPQIHSPPLGRTTHVERRRAVADEEADDDKDIARLPGSPSPAPALHNNMHMYPEMGVPRFDLPSRSGDILQEDPFTLPQLQDEPLPQGDDSRDVSMGAERFPSKVEAQSSPNEQEQLNSSGGRTRITREEVQRRLSRARSASLETPVPNLMETVPEVQQSEDVTMEDQSKEDDSMEHDGYADAEEDEFREEREEEARFEEAERARELEHEASFSTEIGVIQVAEIATVATAATSSPRSPVVNAPTFAFSSPGSSPSSTHAPTEHKEPESDDFGLRAPGLGLDFGSRFGLGGLGINLGDTNSIDSRTSGGEMLRAAERREPERMAVDMDMRSALDRLMEDVAGAGGETADDSMGTEEAGDESAETYERHVHPVVRAATDSALLQMQMGEGAVGLNRRISVASSSSLLSLPPPVPPKDNIRAREAMIIERRREMRRFEEEEEGYGDAPPGSNVGLRAGRPSGRRSMSTGDAQELTRLRGKGLLDIGASKDDLLGATIEKELNKLEDPHKRKYHVRQHEGTIYASSSDSDRIAHMAGAGDVDAGKAWRTVRRPSDMNEYSKQIKEYRAQQNPGKGCGKVFVKVLGVRGMHLPLPNRPTAVTCTLNNGIHFVTTPEVALGRDCRIEQEFELIEHNKLEFTLTLKVRRDPHIVSQFKALVPAPVQPAPVPPPIVQQASSKSGKRSFWSSSPKKSKDKAPPPPPAPTPAPIQQAAHRLPENLARYLKPDGTLCSSTNYPLIGQRVELGGKTSTLQVGELVLQMFRLPPLPGIPADQLPQSLDECHRGLRHINWHKVTYFQGTLTQNGGDCSTWRRRQLRVIGASLVAFNDVTKKATATIDLKKAIAVEDDQDARGAMSPASAKTSRSTRDDYDGVYGVERSFRLVFPNDQEIAFFADTDEEKAKWLEILRALVGHIPPHPLWGELLWQRQEELAKRSQAGP